MTALFLRKGSPLHNKVGTVFFVSMLLMTSAGAIMAVVGEISMTSFMAGSVTFYVVATAWSTARNRTGKNGLIEVAALFYIFIISVVGIISCWELVNGRGEAIGGGEFAPLDFFLFFYSGMGVLCLILDVTVLYRGGIYGAQRVARHLWRMCFGLWVASASFFLGQPQVFPDFLSDPFIRAIPVVVVVVVWFFWLARVYMIRRFKLIRSIERTSGSVGKPEVQQSATSHVFPEELTVR